VNSEQAEENRRKKERKMSTNTTKAKKIEKRRQDETLTCSNSRDCAKTLCHGLLSLVIFFLGVS
jgi:hypothetical protein